MTDQSDEPLVPNPGSNNDQTNENRSSTPEEPGQPVSDNPIATAETEDGLPEWEPLTPELVEDEAIRGDFVIRWTVVGLALLLGFSQIAETRSLLHLKSGQYLAEHGFLPTANDVFSYTASDRKWVNLSWLFDLMMAGVHAVGGGIGLSIVQGIVVGLSFGLLAHAVRPNIRTWWGSICVVLALLVCYPQFTIQPELATLLGLTFVLWTLVTSEESGQSQRLWGLVPAIWLWAQCDPRAWFGWFLMLLWMAGQWISRSKATVRESGPMGLVTIVSLAVVAVHPFLWESWLAPVRMYLNDYPAMRFAYAQPTTIDLGFYPIWDGRLWQSLNHRTIAALFLAAATLVMLILNHANRRWSHLFAFIGFNLLSLFATREFAAASLVNCVICTLNAQDWYREKFGQVYSIDWRELLFSRGGRAVTVIGFFALAWLILSGRLDGPDGKRTGVGFDVHLANAMNDYQQLKPLLIDDHPFHFSIRQGDLMLWGGQKTFVDRRVGLFYGDGDANLLDVHNKTRRAMRDPQNASGQSIDWKSIFEKYQITTACPRLNGPVPTPDYGTFTSLLDSADFQFTALNGSTAVFVRRDATDATRVAYLKDHQVDLVDRAFRAKADTELESVREFAKAATSYENVFSLRRTIVPAGVQFGEHYLHLAATGPNLFKPQRCAAAYLGIRQLNEGLRSDPNSSQGYRTLGLSYYYLQQLEAEILGKNQQNPVSSFRYYQVVSMFQQYLALKPDDAGIIQQLLMQYEVMGRADVRLDLVRKLLAMMESVKDPSDELRKDLDRLAEVIRQLDETVVRIENMVNDNLAKGADRLQVARAAVQVGGLLQAIKTLEEDRVYLERTAIAKVALGSWLMEVGRIREASELFESLEVMAESLPFTTWREPAAISAMMVANYPRAVKLWAVQADAAIKSQLESTLNTLPFMTLNPQWMGPDSYPLSNVGSTTQTIQALRIEGVTSQFHIAVAKMELGDNEGATKAIQRAIELNPTSSLGPLLRFYLECLTGEKLEPQKELSEVEEFDDITESSSTPAVAPSEKPSEKPADKPADKAEATSDPKPE